jgi:hypothetical protein
MERGGFGSDSKCLGVLIDAINNTDASDVESEKFTKPALGFVKNEESLKDESYPDFVRASSKLRHIFSTAEKNNLSQKTLFIVPNSTMANNLLKTLSLCEIDAKKAEISIM